MFTLPADGGICAECRAAESLLRQRQLGGQMRGESGAGCAAVVMEEAVAHIGPPEQRCW